MAENDVTIQINLDAKDAQAAIELFGKESTKVLKNTEKQSDSFFNVFKSGALRLAGSVTAVIGGFAAIRQGINDAVEEAKLTRQIEASLLAVGDASSATVQGILDFADAIKSATGVSDDLVKSTFITAQNFGISTEKAKELTVAAIDLAAATGTDVESAVRLLGGTFDGTVGKLGNYGEEFRNLTKAQLEAGDAIDLVSKKFGGAAAKDLDTFSGRLGQLSNSFGDFLKQIGRTVTESPAVQEALKATAEGIDGVTEALKRRQLQEDKNVISASAFYPGAGGLIQAAAEQQRLLNEETKAFADINIGGQSKAIAAGFAGIVQQAQGATSATASLLERFNQISTTQAPKALGLTGKALEDTKKKAEEAAKAFEQLKGKFGTVGTDELTKIKARYEQERVEVENFSKKYVNYRTQAAQLIVNIEKNKADDVYKYNLEQAQKLNDEIRKNAEQQKSFLESIFQNPFGNFAQRFQDQVVRAIEFAKTGIDIGSPFKEGEIAASISGGLALALQGKEGARKAIGQIGEVIGTSFGIPGLGAITELLSKGPEETKKFIKAFVESVPDLIIAIAESIPVVVDALVDTLINKGGIVKIAIALAKALTFAPVWANIAEKIFGKPSEELFEGAAKDFTQGITQAGEDVKGFFDGLGPALEEFFGVTLGKALEIIFTDLPNDIGEAFSQFGANFSKGGEKFVKDFVGSFKSFFAGFGEAFSTFFTDFFGGLGSFFEGFANSITEPLANLFDPFVAFIQRFLSSFAQLDQTFNEIGRAFKDLGSGIQNVFSGLSDAISGISNLISNLFEPIERLIGTFSGGKGGGQGVIAEFFNTLAGSEGGGRGVIAETFDRWFSKGGLVYAADGFFQPRGTDTVPAMLTPGELVVPRDLVGELGAFLMSQKSEAPGSDAAMLSAIYAAVSGPIVVKTEAKVNQQAFADIILQLNRQNARLIA